MNGFAILAISHGHFAREAVKSAEMIVGKQNNLMTISVTEEKDLDAVLSEINEAYDKLDTENGLLVLADILGGTPSNVTGNLILREDNVYGVTSFNLPVLIQLFLQRDREISEVLDEMKKTFQESYNNLNELLNQGGEDNEY